MDQAAELEQPKTARPVFPDLAGDMPGRVQSVDLNHWTDAELEALAAWIELVKEARSDHAREQVWEERSRTVVSVRYVHESIRCGKETCKCAGEEGELHGPYWYRIETLGNGRSRRKYHGKKPPPALARQGLLSFEKEKQRREKENGSAPRHKPNATKRHAGARAVRVLVVRKLPKGTNKRNRLA